MAVEVGDILRVSAIMQNADSGMVANVFHVRVASLASPSLPDDDAKTDVAAYVDGIYAPMNNLIANDIRYDTVNVFNVTQNRPLGNEPWPTLTLGANTDEILPSTVAAFIQGNSGYSRTWARKFLGGLTTASNTSNGFIEPATVTALAGWGARWIAGYTSGAFSVYEPVVYRSVLALWVPVLEVIVRDVWATIRRRRAYRGA